LTISERSNYFLREKALLFKKKDLPTAILTHGANPGLVSHFVKQALLNMAQKNEIKLEKTPQNRKEWAELMKVLGIRAIHISERDTQVSKINKKLDEFVNTWSVDGLTSEGRYFHN
jgi:homospermidine synthase